MADHTPNGWPYPQPADALVDYPALGEQLATLLDTHALIGLPAMRVTGPDFAVPNGAEAAIPLTTQVYGQGGMLAASGSVQVPRTAVYAVQAQVSWVSPGGVAGYRLARVSSASVEVARSQVPPSPAGIPTIQTLAGTHLLPAGAQLLLYLTQNAGGPLTVTGALTFLAVTLVADIPPGLLRDLLGERADEAQR